LLIPAIRSFNILDIPEKHPILKTVQFCRLSRNRWLA